MTGEEPIVIEVEFNGATEAARGAKSVGKSVADMAAQQTAAATKAIAFAQRIQAASSAVSQLADSLGVEGSASGLIARMASTSSSFAQMGLVLGPSGALVGGITGALLPALGSIRESMSELEERNREARERIEELEEAHESAVRAIRESTEAIDEQSAALLTASERMRGFIRTLSVGGLQDQAFDAAAQISELSNQLASVNDEIRTLGNATGSNAAMRLLEMRERAAELTDQIRRLSAEVETTQTEIRANTAPRRDSGRAEEVDRLAGQINEIQTPTVSAATSPETRAAIEQIQRLREVAEAAFRAINEHSADFDEQLRTAATAIADVEIATQSLSRTEADLARQREEDHTRRVEQMELEKEKGRQLADEEHQRVIDRMHQTAEYEDALMEANRRLEEAYRAQAESYKETTGVIVGGLADALAQVIAGQKSAEEAFKGLLASFLKFISEQSILKAASEYAFAIADFASQNYGGGAAHLAAGVAFTAVAVAAGAGSAALSAPSGSAGGPEEGRSSRDNEGGGGGTVVINYNSPVIALSDRAQMGRELRGLMSDADSRFGA